MKEGRIALVLSAVALLISVAALGVAMTPFYLQEFFTLSCSPSPTGEMNCIMEPAKRELGSNFQLLAAE
ncbi:MAG: hypothetical protein HY001_02845 [Candidatus Portnoybacteria bacterium]|nr:hypothetical protein [Candidatus Portnoybacteria bacterium]